MADLTFSEARNGKNIVRTQIDPRLIKSYTRVLSKLHAFVFQRGYHDRPGYNYRQIFDEFVYTDDDEKKLKIIVSKEPDKIGAYGFYNTYKNEIHVDESVLDNEELLEHVLCHEFIHFLVHINCIKVPDAEPDIVTGGMIDEALTEMLATTLTTYIGSYKPQVAMLTFANVLAGKENNFGEFLKSKIDAKIASPLNWKDFLSAARKFQMDYKNEKMSIATASKNPYYLLAQRKLITATKEVSHIDNLREYVIFTKKLQYRPAEDNKWMDELYEEIDSKVLNTLLGPNSDDDTRYYFKMLLSSYRAMEEGKLEAKEEVDITIDDRKVVLYKYEDHIRAYLPDKKEEDSLSTATSSDGSFSVYLNGKKHDIDVNTLDFNKQKRELEEAKKRITAMMKTVKSKDIGMIDSLHDKDNLVRLERFTVPNLDGKISSEFIYVATYEDHTELLGPYLPKGEINDILLLDYRGSTEQGARCFRPLGTIEEGTTFTYDKENAIKKKILNKLIKDLETTLTDEQKDKLIEDQRKKHPEDEDKPVMELEEDAIYDFAISLRDELTPEKTIEIVSQLEDTPSRIIIREDDGEIKLSILDKEYAIEAHKDTLIDREKDAPLNRYFNNILLYKLNK